MRDEILAKAKDRKATSIDYIIVGSGAGGGPLAARLVEGGARVLLVEAGSDEIEERGAGSVESTVLESPLLHGQSVEDQKIAWDFRVRHFENPLDQQKDTKAVSDPENTQDPNTRLAVNKPRSSALGGCTAHHAMITAYGCDDAWETIRKKTGDDSWHPQRMRRYFERIENCTYRKPFTGVGKFWRRFIAFFSSKQIPVLGGLHGKGGWLTTTVTDPFTALGDSQLVGLLAKVFKTTKRSGLTESKRLAKAISEAALDRDLDVNDDSHWQLDLKGRNSRAEGVRLIPLSVKDGKRFGVRERLRAVEKKYPDRLLIVTDTLVEKVILERKDSEGNGAPKAVGIQWKRGKHLYRASPLHTTAIPEESDKYYSRGEVILSGGAYNTPQLLMLSGIGPGEHLQEHGIKCEVNSPGVGGNLQDRYEVCVVSELEGDFSSIKGVNFDPSDTKDKQLRDWRNGDVNSLYASNGGAIAILKKTKPELVYPDIFMFAAPAMFRGYYPGWSTDVLRRPLHGSAPGETPDAPNYRNQLSWVILKSRAKNKAGTVRLRSSDPLATPVVSHRNYGDGATEERELEDAEEDMTAMKKAVKFARSLNDGMGNIHKQELWPGAMVANESPALEDWIRYESWGHHPCGTCRIGNGGWSADVSQMKDRNAVLDSKFRVHGVQGLRVVDASVFPEIPGYFIVTPIYCISEKAADDILQEFSLYPKSLAAKETQSILARREEAASQLIENREEQADDQDDAEQRHLPKRTVGLALSGGGIRSATFGLGVLQSLAKKSRISKIDIMSTVSGGGYIGSFLGRLFEREYVSKKGENTASSVEKILSETSSAPLRWLRTQADYVRASGPTDDRQNLAVFLRNLFTVHVILGIFAIALFGIPRAIVERIHFLDPNLGYSWLSPLWVIPVGIFTVFALPCAVGYWSAPRPKKLEAYNFWPMLASIFALVALAYGFVSSFWQIPGIIGVSVFASSFVAVELVRLRKRPTAKEYGRVNLKLSEGVLIRNRLTRALGLALIYTAYFSCVTALDSAARFVAQNVDTPEERSRLIQSVLGLWTLFYTASITVAPWMRSTQSKEGSSKKKVPMEWLAGAAAVVVSALLLLGLGSIAHYFYERELHHGTVITIVALVLSFVLSRAIDFLNRSSLHSAYSARLTRTFLGASNEERTRARPDEANEDVNTIHPLDDVAFGDYHPEDFGGPLHLINTCLNETVDYRSFRSQKGRKGISMACGPCGISIGRNYHGLWVDEGEEKDEDGATISTKRTRKLSAAVPILNSVDHYHPFKTDGSNAANPMEPLTLGSWMAISGAAFSTGLGSRNSFGLSLLAGLANVRLGYWWDAKPKNLKSARYFPNLWQRIRNAPKKLYRLQSMLFNEFTGRFYGPNERRWYLSDGGHFENTALYELLRRRLPFMIACDAGRDSKFELGDLAILTRLARIDFGTEITYVSPERPDGQSGWAPVEAAAESDLPTWIKEWINPDAIGTPEELGKTGCKHAVLAKATYPDGSLGWILILKPSLSGDEDLDLLEYKKREPDFPQHSTADQSYDEAQWESYRNLGEHIGGKLFR